MAVIIEELQAEVAPPASPTGREETPAPAQQEGTDERKVLEAVALESWRVRRLAAD
jgi:hypothetical protein